MPESKTDKKDTVYACIDSETLQAIDRWASLGKVSRSVVIQVALRYWLNDMRVFEDTWRNSHERS